jgi:small subunit ribosomal protein S4
MCRREGIKLYLKGEKCLTKKCPVERRPVPPGQHGQRRRKQSEYSLHLREKQKARRIYGVLEEQFRRTFHEAQRRPGITGTNLMQLLELRLDNVVYRLGFATSRDEARQIVRHGHFTVNGRKTDIPSYRCRPNDVIAVTAAAKQTEYFKTVAELIRQRSIPPWLSLDADQLRGTVLAIPERADCDQNVNDQLVVEYYSARI